MPFVRLAENLLRYIKLNQSRSWTMQLEVGKGQSQVSFSIIRLQLERSLKILNGLGGFVKIVQHVAAIDVTGCHLRIAFQSPGEVGERFARLPVACMQVAGDQSEIFVIGEEGIVFFD